MGAGALIPAVKLPGGGAHHSPSDAGVKKA